MGGTILLPPGGRIQVEGAQLNYAVSGRGRPLVVVPGGPGLGFGYLCRELTDLLGGQLGLLFYDQRGSGHSSGAEDPAKLTMRTFVEDLERLRQAAGLARMRLLGHSFGGLLALHYALAHPERTARLILLDSDPASRRLWSGFQQTVEARRTGRQKRQLEEIQGMPGWQADPALMERYYRIFLAAYFAQPKAAARLKLGLDEQVLSNMAVTSGRIRQDLGEWDIHRQLSRIACPTLILCGEASIFPAQSGPALQRGIPESRLLRIKGAGHFPHMEAPQQFVEAVTEFLEPE